MTIIAVASLRAIEKTHRQPNPQAGNLVVDRALMASSSALGIQPIAQLN
ncbi:MAG: hypothetical protein KME17_07030 [Cyanosarcina radialis HA8281-LM2]|nr:hypothetical protein [Cyanosarcina radialis HA8281-LM2]